MNNIHQIIEECKAILDADPTPGAALALLLDGEPLVQSGIGFADLHGQTPMPADGLFAIYSITKSLIATAVLQLAAQGRLDLDHPIQQYLPELALPASVSIRQLLNHTGGLPDYGGLSAYTEALRSHPCEAWDAQEFFAQTLPRGLLFAPGEGWQYSNIGYLVLRQLLERLYSASLHAIFQQIFFAPLGLTKSRVAEDLTTMQSLLPGYSDFFSQTDTLQDIRSEYHPGWVSHGVVLASVAELATLVDAIFCKRFFPQPYLESMLEPVVLPFKHHLFQQPAYGLGLMLDAKSPYGICAGHGGGGPGYASGMFHLPNVAGRRITSVAIANADCGELGLNMAYLLASKLADQLLETT